MEIKETTEVEQKILDAAKVIFVKKGYDATSMGDIAAQAGISRTALNYYFRTKENLFEAIFGEVIRTFIPRLEVIANKPVPFIQKVEPIVEQYIDMLLLNPLLPVFIIGEMQRDAQHLFEVVAGMKSKDDVLFKLSTQIINEMEQGMLRKMPLIDVVSTFFGMLAFPVLAKNILSLIFLDGNREQFNIYFKNRGKLVTEVLTGLLAVPVQNDKADLKTTI